MPPKLQRRPTADSGRRALGGSITSYRCSSTDGLSHTRAGSLNSAHAYHPGGRSWTTPPTLARLAVRQRASPAAFPGLPAQLLVDAKVLHRIYAAAHAGSGRPRARYEVMHDGFAATSTFTSCPETTDLGPDYRRLAPSPYEPVEQHVFVFDPSIP